MTRWAALTLLALVTAGCTARPAPPPAPPPAEAPSPQAEPPPPQPKPAPSVSILPKTLLQGDFATLRVEGAPDGTKVAVKGLNEQPKVYSWYGDAVAFVGFPAAARPAAYQVTVTWEGGEWHGEINVVQKRFTEDRLVVTEEQQAVYFDPRQAVEWARVFQLRAASSPSPLWRGPFELPLRENASITTYFGEIRFVNGVETGRHSGMDFGTPTGTLVYAPAGGRVIFAEKMIVTGNTVIIDHGYSLFTAYYHCDKLLVKPGDEVNPGTQIATVGSTGFSTGPHLHWTATIGNTPVDPWPLTQRPPLGLYPLPADRPERTR